MRAGFAAKQIDVGDYGRPPRHLLAVSVRTPPVKGGRGDLPIGASEYLLAKPGITKISQLRGKPVAYTTGTAEQAFALRGLATAGLTQKDVPSRSTSASNTGTPLESGPRMPPSSASSRRSTISRGSADRQVLANGGGR